MDNRIVARKLLGTVLNKRGKGRRPQRAQESSSEFQNVNILRPSLPVAIFSPFRLNILHCKEVIDLILDLFSRVWKHYAADDGG